MKQTGSRYFKLRTLNKIFDSKEQLQRYKGNEFEVTDERFNEMRETLQDKFDSYFLILEIKHNGL